MEVMIEERESCGKITQEKYWDIIAYIHDIVYEYSFSPARLLIDYSEEDIWEQSPAITPLDIRAYKSDGGIHYGTDDIYMLNLSQKGISYMINCTYYLKDTLLNSGYYKIKHKHNVKK